MSLSRTKTWIAGEVLTASDLNAEFNNILSNPMSLISPLTAGVDFDGYTLTLDAAAVTTFNSTAAIGWNFTTGAKAGTPSTTGSIANWSAQTFTDSATAASGTATSWVGFAIQRPTLAATSVTVTTTDAATVYIPNAPAAGTNQTLTNAWACWIDDGASRFDGNVHLNNANLVFEGATADAFETSLTVTDPTADRTITLPNSSGNMLLDDVNTILYARVFS